MVVVEEEVVNQSNSQAKEHLQSGLAHHASVCGVEQRFVPSRGPSVEGKMVAPSSALSSIVV